VKFTEQVGTVSIALAIVLLASGINRLLETSGLAGGEWLMLGLAIAGAAVMVFGALAAYHWARVSWHARS
jgi:hypothetical protein